MQLWSCKARALRTVLLFYSKPPDAVFRPYPHLPRRAFRREQERRLRKKSPRRFPPSAAEQKQQTFLLELRRTSLSIVVSETGAKKYLWGLGSRYYSCVTDKPGISWKCR